jgi:hypothetical protein
MKEMLVLLLGLIPTLSFAQSYSIDWYKIAGGGGTSTGAVYAISGTIGQPDASGALTGGNYSLTGGFWCLYAVQTVGLPPLSINFTGSAAIVSWPNTAACSLQQNSGLVTGTWVNSTYTVNTRNGTNRVTIASPSGKLFFRLVP